MVRAAFVDSNGMKKGAWSVEEDDKLRTYIQRYGHWNWRLLPEFAKLKRSGKSCRLRWVNYLKPGVKKGNFNKHEEDLIIELHAKLGNKWSKISSSLPGRTDNEIKNFWHGHIVKKNRTRNNPVKEIPNNKSMDPLDKHASSPVLRASETNYFSDNSYTESNQVSDFWTDSFLLDIDAYTTTQVDYVPLFQDLEQFMLSDFGYDESNTSNPSVDWNADYNDHSMIFCDHSLPCDNSSQGSFSTELFEMNDSNAQNENSYKSAYGSGIYDHFFKYSDDTIGML